MSGSEKDNNKDALKRTEPRRVATLRQIDYLIDFLREHEELRYSKMRSKEGMHIMRKLWDACTERLNKLGPSRNSKEWTKYWSDLKCRVKQKAAEMSKRSAIDGLAGEGNSSGPSLTYVETKVINLLECDRQNTYTPEIPLNYSGGSMNYTLIKEENDEDMQIQADLNVEEFISSAPVVENVVPIASVQLPANQSDEIRVSRNSGMPQKSLLQPPPTNSVDPAMPLSQTRREPPNDRVPSVPPEVSFTPKRGRRRRTVGVGRTHVQQAPIRSFEIGQCIANIVLVNCTELKEFANLMLKLKESHARTSRIQAEASLKVTEVLKLQAEGIMHTGVALREMANNLCRLLERQLSSNKPSA